jgi:hypothetical protein
MIGVCEAAGSGEASGEVVLVGCVCGPQAARTVAEAARTAAVATRWRLIIDRMELSISPG